MSGISKRVSGSWVSGNYGIMKTSTDTITTLPADLYPNDITATVGLKGQMVQSGTPTPQNPIQPSETGDRTAQLWDISSWDGATAQRGILERVTNGYKLTATSNDAYTTTYGSGAYSYSVIGGNEYTISWTVDNPLIYGVMYIFTGISVADTPLTTAVAASGSKTFTVPSGHNYVALRLGVSSIGNEITYTNIMLNTGSTPLPYEPYGYKLDIKSANTTTPVYLGEVQSTRRIKKLVLDGTENWNEGTSKYYIFIDVSGKGDGVPNSTALSTHTESGAVVNNNGTALFFKKSVFVHSSLADFKTYLQQQYANGTPVTVWYVLANETTTTLNEPLRKIGNYADSVSVTGIPTTTGKDTFDVLTTLRPSEVTVNYHGWHTGAVHERESGAWT